MFNVHAVANNSGNG